jgi:hypothetical protein
MRRIFLVVALAAMLLVPVSQAAASSHHPKGAFSVFSECPLNNVSTENCIYSKSSSGFFTLGKKTVPLVNPVILQGGLKANPETFENEFIAAENGDTLSKTAQPVPGGLLGIEAPASWPKFLRDLFNNFINEGLTGVTATVELAAPASAIKISPLNLITETGTALSLPVKIKLSNAFLGSNCYIGSNSSPVTIAFTTGETSPPLPNKPIHGSKGTIGSEEEGKILVFSGGKLVNNSFAAPGANGCGGIFSFLIDPFVNEIVGLPSAAGHNTAILEGKIETAAASAVRASE